MTPEVEVNIPEEVESSESSAPAAASAKLISGVGLPQVPILEPDLRVERRKAMDE
jgi:hypothetical protein